MRTSSAWTTRSCRDALGRQSWPSRFSLVDDDRNTAKYLSAVLSDNGYDPILAYDGSEGLAKVKQSTPDLIVLDVMMPKKTGFVLFKQLKEDKRYRDIPILMLSGVSRSPTGTRGSQRGDLREALR